MFREWLTFVSLVLLIALPWSPMPPASAQSANPCTTALASESVATRRAPAVRAPKHGRFGDDTRDVRDLLQQSALASQAASRALTAARPAADRDENNIAILEDRGDLIARPNPFDLANSGIRFEPSGSGYAIAATGAEFRTPLGTALTLIDDDSTAQAIAFAFPFYGRQFSSMFVNSDGNITFEEPDNASTARGLGRLTSGAPRVAPFFADLDPSAGGRVFLNNAPDGLTLTWCAVPGFGLSESVTVQATLLPTGAVEFRFGTATLSDSIVALSPGRNASFVGVDLRASGQVTEAAAIGELFSSTASLDLVTASRRFYETHPDNFDQLVFWTDSPVVSDAFAFESSVKNAITGTGLPVFDFSAEFGSGGALQSVVNMDHLAKYPDSPSQLLGRVNTTLGILAHETGHRWLARLSFRDANREVSEQLLGRQLAHWSFFMDSDGSVMEGNDIQDLGGGTFRTTSATEKYSRLDMYAMGLAAEAEVPRWFYVEPAPDTSFDREEPAMPGTTFKGTRRDVLIQDVVDALGPRVPAAADSPKVHRQAYVYVRQASGFFNAQDLAKLGRIREQFEPFFRTATENRMTVRTTLTR